MIFLIFNFIVKQVSWCLSYDWILYCWLEPKHNPYLFSCIAQFIVSTVCCLLNIVTIWKKKYRWVAAQSIFYHLYNQVSYMSLDEISPLTFSIGNTMKRISVIVSSIIIFRTPVQPVNALGAAIAVLGTFIYSQVITCSLNSLLLGSSS